MADSTDPTIRDLSSRLRDRRLYKAIDVREEIRGDVNSATTDEGNAVDKACASINEKITEWVARHDGASPRLLVDQAERDPYKPLQESKGPLNQIRIRTTGGELVDLGKRSRVVAAIEKFQLYRVYLSEADDSARKFVRRLINEEVKQGRAGSGRKAKARKQQISSAMQVVR
jgi:HD superfamily phosphohydrolase